MSFLSHKITAFETPISSLPDEPNLSSEELKRCFDSAPEQLRQSVNGLCDDAERLDTRVEGIVAQTYEDTIHESMLDTPLQTKINSKADAAANTAAHTALETAVAAKCEVYIGTYEGDGADSQFINLGFTPKALLVFARGCALYPGFTNCVGGVMAVPGQTILIHDRHAVDITENGFIAHHNSSYSIRFNAVGTNHYIAFR